MNRRFFEMDFRVRLIKHNLRPIICVGFNQSVLKV